MGGTIRLMRSVRVVRLMRSVRVGVERKRSRAKDIGKASKTNGETNQMQ